MSKHLPQNPNAFQCDAEDPGDAQRPAVSIRCPHCRELGSFQVVRSTAFTYAKKSVTGNNTRYFGAIRMCPNRSCKGLVFVIETQAEIVEVEPPQLLDFTLDNLPPRCQLTLKEAVACHGAGAYRAAAMMVRRLLEEICDENGARGGNLHQRIQALQSKIVLPPPLFEAMSELKALGNDSAHVEARAYDSIGPEEATDSIELAKEILKGLYQLRGLVERLQSRKKVAG